MNLERATARVFLFRILGLAGRAAAVVVLSRSLGPSAFGEYNVILVLATLGASLGCFGINQAHAYYLNRGEITDAQAFGNSLATTAVVVLALGIAMVFLPGRVAAIQWSFGTQAAFVGLTAMLLLQSHVATHLLARDRVILYGVLTQGYQAMFCVLAAAAVFLGNRDLGVILALYALALAVPLLVGLTTIARMSGFQVTFSMRWLGVAAKYGSMILVGNVIWGMAARLDYLLVSSLAGTSAVGVYAIATNVAELFWVLPLALASTLLPAVSRRDQDAGLRLVLRSCRIVLALTVAAGLVALLPIALLIVPVFGSAYEGAFGAFLLLMPGTISLAFVMALFQYYYGSGRPGWPTVILAVTVGIDVIGNLVFTPTWGPLGAALAQSIAYVLGALMTVAVLRRGTNTSFAEMFFLTSGDRELLMSPFRALLARRPAVTRP